MNPKISIIVPVHNAEEYLDRCMNSIQEQTYHNFEVILVDDGSTDQSGEIISKWSNEDSRFFTFHKENGGVSSARNEGLRQVSGDYICFVDADDTIATTFLEDLYNAMGDQADSSMGGLKRIDLLSHTECEVVPEKKFETLEENLLGFYATCSTDWQRYMVNRMFKKSIIQKNNLRFQESIYYKEDGLFLVQYLCASNGLVGCVDKVLYYYYRNTTGAMSKTWQRFDKKIITNLEAHRSIIETIKNKGLSIILMRKAKEQAKAACNWILSLMYQTKSFNLSFLLRIEKIMISVLGLREYFAWRVSQLDKKLK